MVVFCSCFCTGEEPGQAKLQGPVSPMDIETARNCNRVGYQAYSFRHTPWVLCLCNFSPDGSLLVMASYVPELKQSNLRIVEIYTGAVKWEASVEGAPGCMKVSPDGKVMGYSSEHISRLYEDGQYVFAGKMRIVFWDVAMGTAQQEFIGFDLEDGRLPVIDENSSISTAFSFSSDSKLAAVAWGHKLRIGISRLESCLKIPRLSGCSSEQSDLSRGMG